MQPEQTARSRPVPDRRRGGRPLTLGEALEARVAQLWFWEGFYSRHGVDLTHHFGPERARVTDLDLLAFDFNPQLTLSKYIGEVKSGTGKNADKPLDRIIWLRGLRALVGAEAAELTIAHAPTDSERELGRGLGIIAQSMQDFERREQEAVGALADIGAHGTTALEMRIRAREICRRDPELERAYWFLRSGVWFLEPFTAIKQLIDLLRRVNRRWTPRVQDDDTQALRWLMADAVSILTLNLVTVSGYSLTLDKSRFYKVVSERLAQGEIPASQMRRLSDSVDKYIAGILTAAKAPADVKTQAIGAFMPEPPEWAEPLAEVTWRIGRTPLPARAFPRQIDLLAFERLARNREVPEHAARRAALERTDAARLRTLVAAFLRGCGASPDLLDQTLVTAVPTSYNSNTEIAAQQKFAPDQEALFGETSPANNSERQT